MKVFIWVIGLILITQVAFADTSAEVISIDKDTNGNIRVWTQYKIDGVEVSSRYPAINGKQVYCSRYNVLNFVSMNDTEITTRILEDVNAHAQSLIQMTYIEKANTEIMDNHLKDVVGSNVTQTTTSIYVDTDNDGVQDTEWVVKTDGTRTERPYSPPAVITAP